MMYETDARLRMLREAISIESYGYDFYNLMRAQVKDKSAQVVLSFLASMEADHMMWLEKEYMRQLRSTGASAGGHAHGIKMSALEEIFVTDRLPELYTGSDMKIALEFALEVELRSMKFYTDAMNLADDDELKLLFRKLADFEMDHAKLLKLNIENLKRKGIWVEPEGL
jgi:rubrerythrin